MSIPDSEVHLLKTIESKLQSDDWSRFCQFVKKINKEQFDIPSLFAKIENLPSKISRVLMLNIQIHNISWPSFREEK